ncbi:MAG TPA: gluconate:H+ symporter [Povalibacter sp.]|nr:gluconate:H+ symporter [Povalibacter sp.]
MEILCVIAAIALLVVLIAWLKVQPFLAFLLTSLAAGIMLGMPLAAIPGSIEKGIGDTLGGLLGIICLGAMFGKLIAQSGAARKIALVLMNLFGEKRITWALMVTGFIVGIPLFYNVGFVLLIPLVFSVVYQSRLPAVYLGVALLASLSVTHCFLPPHPSPTAIVPMFNASMSTTLVYGLIIAVPAMIVAGPLFARSFRSWTAVTPQLFKPEEVDERNLPGTFNCFATALLPVLIIALSAALPPAATGESTGLAVLRFLTNPLVVMLLSLLVATVTLGTARGFKLPFLMEGYAGSVKDVAVILLIIAGAGALKQVFIDTGVSRELSTVLQGLHMNPLLLGWLITALIRVSLGSATVAGLTSAGIMAPVVAATGANPNLMVLAIGAGSVMFSHVNDSGFWMFKEYFNLNLKQTLLSWSVMEIIIGVMGLIGVLVLDVFV